MVCIGFRDHRSQHVWGPPIVRDICDVACIHVHCEKGSGSLKEGSLKPAKKTRQTSLKGATWRTDFLWIFYGYKFTWSTWWAITIFSRCSILINPWGLLKSLTPHKKPHRLGLSNLKAALFWLFLVPGAVPWTSEAGGLALKRPLRHLTSELRDCFAQHGKALLAFRCGRSIVRHGVAKTDDHILAWSLHVHLCKRYEISTEFWSLRAFWMICGSHLQHP